MSDNATSKLPLWLIVSLLANALLIGLLIGGGLGHRKAGPSPGLGGGEQALIRGIDEAVPSDQRRAVRQAFRRAFSESRQQRVLMRDARRDLGELVSAEPYDAEAVREGFRRLREADAAMKAQMHDLLAEQFSSLTAEQRQAVIRDVNRRDRFERGRGGERSERRPPKDRD